MSERKLLDAIDEGGASRITALLDGGQALVAVEY